MQCLKKERGTCFFILIQVILYSSFLILDFTAANINLSNKFKFSIVVLCLCYTLFYSGGVKQRQLLYLQLALFFTVVSDLFILLLEYYLYGMIAFCIVQQLYSRLLDLLVKQDMDERQILTKRFLLRLGLQIAVTIFVCFVLLIVGIYLEVLIVVIVFYFVSIVTNVIRAVKLSIVKPKDKSNIIYAVGMLLFLFCDINVGLFNASDYLALSGGFFERIYSFTSILMWLFYAPAQVLIVLSPKFGNISQK